MSDAVKLEREKRKTLKAQRDMELQDKLLDVLLSPNMVRLYAVMAIIAYSTYVCRSKDKQGPVTSAVALALPSIGIPMLAADAGIKDKYALGAIAAAAGGYVTGQMLVGWGEAGVLPDLSNPASWPELVLRSYPGGGVLAELLERLPGGE